MKTFVCFELFKSPDFWRHNFHNHSEQDSKPGLSKKVVGDQASLE